MSAIDSYHIIVSGLGGKIYLAKPLKSEPYVMSSQRKLVDESEFIAAIEQWAKHKLKNENDLIEITSENNEVIFQIKFPKKV